MACGCSKKKASATSDVARAARVDRVIYQPSPIAPSAALDGTTFRSVEYLVAPKEELLSGDIESAERFSILAHAQKRVRELGPSYGVKATRNRR